MSPKLVDENRIDFGIQPTAAHPTAEYRSPECAATYQCDIDTNCDKVDFGGIGLHKKDGEFAHPLATELKGHLEPGRDPLPNLRRRADHHRNRPLPRAVQGRMKSGRPLFQSFYACAQIIIQD